MVRALLAVPLGRLVRIAIPSSALATIPALHGLLARVRAPWGSIPGALRHGLAAMVGTAVVASAVFGPTLSAPSTVAQGLATTAARHCSRC